MIASFSYSAWRQSHYREVARWEIFMEQELRFGLDLCRLATFEAVFSCSLKKLKKKFRLRNLFNCVLLH